MKLFTNKKKLQKELEHMKNINFVPTMGALHKGHESLIKKSVRESKNTVVSIFVNPKQFDNQKDFKNYPKDIKKDIKLIKRLKVKYLYVPTYRDVYNFKSKNKIFLNHFSRKLCGKFRKNHFKGVINVVNRLIEIINPQKIFLGNKDFQQLFLIKEHVKKNKLKVKINGCKTVRDKNFVAYSSRLKLLNNKEKVRLSRIIKFLKSYKRDLISKKNKHNVSMIKNRLIALGIKKVDYVELIDLKTFKLPKNNKFNIFFAFYIGKIRFIDNF